MVGHGEHDLRVGGDRRAGFRDDLAVDGHLAGEDQRAGALARRHEPALHEGDIEARLQEVTTKTRRRQATKTRKHEKENDP